MHDPFAPRLLARLPPPRKVAIVRASRIGDFICGIPALRAFRKALPHTEITLVAMPLVEDLARRSPHANRFVPFPGFPGMAEQFFDARRTLDFFRKMQAEQFDLAVQVHGSGVYSNPFTLMLGARASAGFIRPGDPPGRLDAALPMPAGLHAVHQALALAEFLGIPSCGSQTELPLWPEDHQSAEDLVSGLDRPLFGIHPAAREEEKRWPPEQFARVGRELHQRYRGTVLMIGGPEEEEGCRAIAREIGPAAVSLAGRTSLPVLGALLARVSLLVTNDSGPAHIGYALGTPTVTLFSATDPSQWGPLDRHRHRVVQVNPDSRSLHQVLLAAEELLAPLACWDARP